MSTKKPQPDFVIRMVGPGLSPWVVPMRKLSRALQAVQRLLDKEDDEDEHTESEQIDEPVLHLIGLTNRSAGYAVATERGELVLDVLRHFGSSIADPTNAAWTPYVLSSVRDLSDVAKSLGCEIEFRLPGTGRNYGEILAKIGPSSFDSIAGHAFATGHTSVYARVERVGGATEMHCGIRIPSQQRRMVICRVASKDLVRELGKYLYEYVVLSGEAEWIRHDWRIRTIVIKSIEPPKTGSIIRALDRIHSAGGSAWDSVDDPKSALQEIRGE